MIDKIWKQMIEAAEDKNMTIKKSNGKEFIVDKEGKAFYVKCKAGDFKSELRYVG